MKILVLAAEFPATTSMPGSPRLFNLCRELARRHQLTLLCRSSKAEQETAFREDTATHGVFHEIQTIPPPPKLHPGSVSWTRRQLHRFSLVPSFVTQFRSPRYWRSTVSTVREAIDRHAPDLVYCDGLDMAQYLPWRSDIPTVVDYCDSLTNLFSQRTSKETSLKRRAALWLETRAIARWEVRI
ncbi:MAG: glycosyltransferase, partial [Bdellovibrionales bacterium]|nr:glycosyltransferase [Bdellovibrionales bacterium]